MRALIPKFGSLSVDSRERSYWIVLIVGLVGAGFGGCAKPAPRSSGSSSSDSAVKAARPVPLSASTFTFFASVRKAEQGTELEGPGIVRWVETRVRNARQGKRELVRIPLAQRSEGWGCRCPTHFIGRSVDRGGGPWIQVAAKSKVDTKTTRAGWVKVAEGYFTGRKIRQDLRGRDKQPPEWLYTLWEFHVLRTWPYKPDTEKIGRKEGGGRS